MANVIVFSMSLIDLTYDLFFTKHCFSHFCLNPIYRTMTKKAMSQPILTGQQPLLPQQSIQQNDEQKMTMISQQPTLVVDGVTYLGIGQPISINPTFVMENQFYNYRGSHVTGEVHDVGDCKAKCEDTFGIPSSSLAADLDRSRRTSGSVLADSPSAPADTAPASPNRYLEDTNDEGIVKLKGFSFYEDEDDYRILKNSCWCWTAVNAEDIEEELIMTDGDSTFGHTYCYDCQPTSRAIIMEQEPDDHHQEQQPSDDEDDEKEEGMAMHRILDESFLQQQSDGATIASSPDQYQGTTTHPQHFQALRRLKKPITSTTCQYTSIVEVEYDTTNPASAAKSFQEQEEDSYISCETRDGKSYRVKGVPTNVMRLHKKSIIDGEADIDLPEGSVLDDSTGMIELPMGKNVEFKRVSKNSSRRGYSDGYGQGNNKPFQGTTPHHDKDFYSNNRHRRHPNNRKLPVTGMRSVLVVRVIAADSQTTASEQRLSDSVFGGLSDDGSTSDPTTLKSQYLACSYGQLNFVMAPDRDGTSINIRNGTCVFFFGINTHDFMYGILLPKNHSIKNIYLIT